MVSPSVNAAIRLNIASMLTAETDFLRLGAASEGDFYAALGMNSVLGGTCIWFCRNNGCVSMSLLSLSPHPPVLPLQVVLISRFSFVISTPIIDQYAGDGIASRGPGYGLDIIRVDGNHALAVFSATRQPDHVLWKGRMECSSRR